MEKEIRSMDNEAILTFTCSNTMKEKIRQLAKSEGKVVSTFLREIVTKGLGE